MTPYAHRKLKEIEDLVNSWDPETRRSFLHDLNTNTPKSAVQLRLAKYGLTVRELRRWANKTWPSMPRRCTCISEENPDENCAVHSVDFRP